MTSNANDQRTLTLSATFSRYGQYDDIVLDEKSDLYDGDIMSFSVTVDLGSRRLQRDTGKTIRENIGAFVTDEHTPNPALAYHSSAMALRTVFLGARNAALELIAPQTEMHCTISLNGKVLENRAFTKNS